jgi:cell division protein FtsW
MWGLSRLDYRGLRALAWAGVAAADAALVVVLVSGVGRWGAQRWIEIGSFTIQPSEFAKLACVFALAAVLTDPRRKERPDWDLLARIALIVVPVLVLVLLQPDMGTAMAILAAAGIVMFLGGVAWRHLVGLVVAIGLAVPALILVEPYRLQRYISFVDPWSDPQGAGYQTIQALLAFGSGGWSGVGLGLSRQKFFYLPAAHTDFVFAIIGEELGLFGTLAVLGAFIVFAYAGFGIAVTSKDRFGRLLAGGLAGVIVLQALMNMAAVTNLMPVTGIPLPFVSYGGSSLVFTLGSVGVILSVARFGRTSARSTVAARAGRGVEKGARDAQRRGDRGTRLPGARRGRSASLRRA